MTFSRLDPPRPLAVGDLFLVETATPGVFEFSDTGPNDAVFELDSTTGVFTATTTPGSFDQAFMVLIGTVGRILALPTGTITADALEAAVTAITTATAALTAGSTALSATISTSATASAALTTAISLNATVTATATVSASLGGEMFPSRAWTATYNQSSAATFVVPLTGGTITADQLILVVVAYDQNHTGSINTTTFPGWSVLAQQSHSSSVTGLIAWKRAEGGETSVTIDWDVLDRGSAVIEVWDNAGNPTATGATGESADSDPPSHTAPSTTNHVVIATRSGDGSTVATAAPTDYIGLTSVASSSGGASTNTAYREVASSQTVNPGPFTSATEQWVSYTIMLPFGAGGGPPLLTAAVTATATASATMAAGAAQLVAAVTATATVSATMGGANDTAVPVAIGMWATKTELDSIAASGTTWTGSGEVYTTAVAWYRLAGSDVTNVTINSTSDAVGVRMREIMAAALVFARLKPASGVGNPVVDATSPSFTCDELRAKIASAITNLINQANSAIADTRPGRFLGGWPIIADLINLPAYDSALNTTAPTFSTTTGTNSIAANTGFRGWLNYCLDWWWDGNETEQLRNSTAANIHNKGACARFSRAASACYLNGALSASTELTALSQVFKRWLGDTSIQTVAGEFSAGSPPSLFLEPAGSGEGNSWQKDPPFTDHTSRVGVNALGANADGNNLDGVQPGDIYRGYYNIGDGTGGADGDPSSYRADFFPNRANSTSFSYTEVSSYVHVGMLHIMYRCGYTDLLTYQNSALLRAIEWINWARINYGNVSPVVQDRDWTYFGVGVSGGTAQEAAQPLIAYLWPSAGLPVSKQRTSASGANFGYAWTWWLFDGRSL